MFDKPKKKIDVSQINVYFAPGAKPNTDANSSAVPVEFVEGKYPGPVLKDLEIESLKVREGLRPDEANLCIGVQPGNEKIGQLHFLVQYEGKKGMTNECMQGQNDLAGGLGDWLNELFRDSPSPWTFAIHVEPCPKAEEPCRVVEMANRLEGIHTLGRQASHDTDVQASRDHRQEHQR